MSALVVIPTFMRTPADLDITIQTLLSVRATEPDVEILCVDDCSPAPALVDALETHTEELNFWVTRQPENGGFSRAVNVGISDAFERNLDVVLMNADIECLTPGWLKIMTEQLDTQGRPASVVGALLIYPNGLIQHAGIFFSFLTRGFDHRYRFGPGELPEAQQACVCPVTGAFQFIRREAVQAIGMYDLDFRMGYEDVDFCLRVFESGRECIYTPKVRALHHESLFRGHGRADDKLNEWQAKSAQTLMQKHARTNMSRFVTEIV
jgi:GT2 family glycosyltransferase